MAQRFWEDTELWAWNAVDPIGLAGSPSLVLEEYAGTGRQSSNGSDDCIRWGERGLLSKTSDDKNAILHLQMAQAYAIKRNYAKASEYLRTSVQADPTRLFSDDHVKQWVILLWNWPDDGQAKALLKIMNRTLLDVTAENLETWEKEKQKDKNLYGGNVNVLLVALQSTSSEATTRLTVYSVGREWRPDGNSSWTIKHGDSQQPEKNEPPWSAETAAEHINSHFFTIGRL